MWTATRIAGVVLVACVSAAACSGGEDATSTTTSTATSAPTPTESLTTSPETAPPTSSTSPSSTTSSAPPSSSSTEPLTDEQAVLAAYQASYDAYFDAAQDPGNPELRRLLQSTTSGEYLQFLTERLDRRVIDGERLRPNPNVDDGYVVESLVLTDEGLATLTVCTTDPWLLVRADDSGDEEVLDAETYVLREEYTLEQQDGTWMVVLGITIEDFSEAGECAG